MKYAKFKNGSLGTILRNPKYSSNGEVINWKALGINSGQVQKLAKQYDDGNGDNIQILPIDNEVLFNGFIDSINEDLAALGDGGTCQLISGTTSKLEAWDKSVSDHRDKQNYEADLNEARKQARIEQLKNRILNPNDELE
jgi:hypothetical protein